MCMIVEILKQGWSEHRGGSVCLRHSGASLKGTDVLLWICHVVHSSPKKTNSSLHSVTADSDSGRTRRHWHYSSFCFLCTLCRRPIFLNTWPGPPCALGWFSAHALGWISAATPLEGLAKTVKPHLLGSCQKGFESGGRRKDNPWRGN